MRVTGPRLAAIVLSVVVALIGVATAPTDGIPVLGNPFEQISELPAAQETAYLGKHQSVALAMANLDPATTADWWSSTSIDAKEKLIRRYPSMLGNLDGIDYRSRDEANRLRLVSSIASARAAIARRPQDPMPRTVLASLLAIDGATSLSHHPRRQLVSLTGDRPPLAAIAVGDLDTASQITFTVSGMGTYTDDMQLWAESAQNVYDDQGRIGAPKRRAVVAWIGYVTPPPGVDAALGDYAARGAPRLAQDIQGLEVVRSHHPAETMSVIAHSYGTTTAADALADNDLGLFAFVMLGSAGIEERIPDASALHSDHVYAGEAVDDREARWGRVTRQDPRSPAFGAQVLGVDGDARLGLLAVTGHDPVLHSAWNDDLASPIWADIADQKVRRAEYLKHTTSFGYLDEGTESLRNAAIATTRSPKAALTN